VINQLKEAGYFRDKRKLSLTFLKVTFTSLISSNITNNALRYTWDNRRIKGRRVLARLDRVYAFLCPQGPLDSHIQGYSILGTCSFSDHQSVLFHVRYREAKKLGGQYKMNCEFLQDQEIVNQLKSQWTSCPRQLPFFGKMRRVIHWYKELSLRKAEERREKEKHLR
jgi:hypothetical protein